MILFFSWRRLKPAGLLLFAAPKSKQKALIAERRPWLCAQGLAKEIDFVLVLALTYSRSPPLVLAGIT